MTYDAGALYDSADQYNTAVAFLYDNEAPYDSPATYDSALPQTEDLRPQGGGMPIRIKTKTRPAWVIPAQFIQIPRAPVEDDEALLLCAAL